MPRATRSKITPRTLIAANMHAPVTRASAPLKFKRRELISESAIAAAVGMAQTSSMNPVEYIRLCHHGMSLP